MGSGWLKAVIAWCAVWALMMVLPLPRAGLRGGMTADWRTKLWPSAVVIVDSSSCFVEEAPLKEVMSSTEKVTYLRRIGKGVSGLTRL
jgi:hypothetical protein